MITLGDDYFKEMIIVKWLRGNDHFGMIIFI